LTRPATQTGHFGDEGDCHEAPSVSPDGSEVIYTLRSSCNYGQAVIRAVTSSGARVRLKLRMPSLPDIEPSFYGAVWSRRSSTVAYVALQLNPFVGAIYTSGANAERPQRVVSSSPDLSGLAWSPDEKWIAYVHNGDIWLVGADGSGKRRVTSGKDVDIAPAWLPPL
jgi:Tol biopolymer transport system component